MPAYRRRRAPAHLTLSSRHPHRHRPRAPDSRLRLGVPRPGHSHLWSRANARVPAAIPVPTRDPRQRLYYRSRMRAPRLSRTVLATAAAIAVAGAGAPPSERAREPSRHLRRRGRDRHRRAPDRGGPAGDRREGHRGGRRPVRPLRSYHDSGLVRAGPRRRRRGRARPDLDSRLSKRGATSDCTGRFSPRTRRPLQAGEECPAHKGNRPRSCSTSTRPRCRTTRGSWPATSRPRYHGRRR